MAWLPSYERSARDIHEFDYFRKEVVVVATIADEVKHADLGDNRLNDR